MFEVSGEKKKEGERVCSRKFEWDASAAAIEKKINDPEKDQTLKSISIEKN